MLTLARATGWSEDFILNELPLSRALQYRHCMLRIDGYWTVPPSAEAGDQLAAAKAAVAGKLRPRAPKPLAPVPAPPLFQATPEAAIQRWLARQSIP